MLERTFSARVVEKSVDALPGPLGGVVPAVDAVLPVAAHLGGEDVPVPGNLPQGLVEDLLSLVVAS